MNVPKISSKTSLFLLLLVISTLTIIPYLGLTNFHTKGEPREAIVAVSMLQNDNWILPINNGGDIAYKPPFFHWCIAALSLPAGEVTEFTSRLPSALAAIIMAVAAAFLVQQSRIKRLTAERDKYRNNTETLLQDVRTYQTKDSLNAAKVGNLELKLSEYKKYRADDAALIKSLQTKNRDLQRVTTAQMETINELRANVRDSIVYLPGDTVTTVLRCIDIVEPWFELHGCTTPTGVFTGTHINRDSLLIAETVQYKRFWGFLWKTKKIKNREIDVVSKNPATRILGVEFVTIEK